MITKHGLLCLVMVRKQWSLLQDYFIGSEVINICISYIWWLLPNNHHKMPAITTWYHSEVSTITTNHDHIVIGMIISKYPLQWNAWKFEGFFHHCATSVHDNNTQIHELIICNSCILILKGDSDVYVLVLCPAFSLAMLDVIWHYIKPSKVKGKVTVFSPHPASELCSADFDKYLPWSLGLYTPYPFGYPSQLPGEYTAIHMQLGATAYKSALTGTHFAPGLREAMQREVPCSGAQRADAPAGYWTQNLI